MGATKLQANFRKYSKYSKFSKFKAAVVMGQLRFHTRKKYRLHALDVLTNCIVPYLQRKKLAQLICRNSVSLSVVACIELIHSFFSAENKTRQSSMVAHYLTYGKAISSCLSTLTQEQLAIMICNEIILLIQPTNVKGVINQTNLNTLICSLVLFLPKINRLGQTLTQLVNKNNSTFLDINKMNCQIQKLCKLQKLCVNKHVLLYVRV